MRLIDADALRQVLEVFTEKDTLGYTPLQLCDAMPTASPWHRVEDELPEETKVVIIHKEWDDEITLGYSYSFGEIRPWMCLKTPYNIYEVPWVGAGHVDYWMPLPEKPKEDA